MDSINKNHVISDFDMTFFNFKQVDNKIIATIFYGHKFVLIVDKFLWKINSLGIIGNSMKGLKLRFLIYSFLTILSTRYIKYIDIFSIYEEMYKKLAKKKYQKKLWLINKIERKGYNFRILTNNKFASELDLPNIIYTKNKRVFLKDNKPEILLGDNYWDDLRNCPKGTQYVNVGGGIISKLKLKNVICINNMYEIFDILR